MRIARKNSHRRPETSGNDLPTSWLDLPRFRAEEAQAVATLGGLSACRRGPRRHEVVSERWRGRGFLAAAVQDMRERSVHEGFPTLGRGREVGLRADLPFRGGENAKGPCWTKRTEWSEVEYGTRSSFLSSRDVLGCFPVKKM
jgi:hypothetical protein